MKPKQPACCLFALLMIVLTGCVQVSYKPPIPIPVKLVVSSSGQVSIKTDDASVVTPWGEFGIGAALPVANLNPDSDILIILQDRNRGKEQVFRVAAGKEARIVTNGTTEIRVNADRTVTIDITNGAVQLVEINGNTVQSNSSIASSSSPAVAVSYPPTPDNIATRVAVSYPPTPDNIATRVAEDRAVAATLTAAAPRLYPSPTVKVISSAPVQSFYSIVNFHTQKCFEAPPSSAEDSVLQATCNGNSNQLWRLASMGNGYSEIITQNSGKCLDVEGKHAEENYDLVQATCIGNGSQLWRLQSFGNYAQINARSSATKHAAPAQVLGDYFQIIAQHSGRCADLDGWSHDNGAHIMQGNCRGSDNDNQLWALR